MKSNNYHNYVFQDGKFIGAFEEMYQNVEDPWHHGDATNIYYDLSLYLINRYKICASGGKVLDLGCGKGAFTAKIKKNLHNNTKITGIDIAPTAIRKAKEKWDQMGINFKVCDVTKEFEQLDIPPKDLDLVIMSDLMWYILPSFKAIGQTIKPFLKDDGYLLISQTFYPSEKQNYGKEIVSSVQDMLTLINYKVVEMIETNRLTDHHVVCLMRKR